MVLHIPKHLIDEISHTAVLNEYVIANDHKNDTLEISNFFLLHFSVCMMYMIAIYFSLKMLKMQI